jgi:hypothetical protein
MGTGNNTIETKDEVIQPDKVVVTDSEVTEAKPQAEATEDQEFYVDDSNGNQEESHKTGMTQAQAYAAFQKKKKQSAQRKEELDASQERETKLQRELDELKATVGSLTKGKAPTLEGCDYDESVYQSQMQEYYANPSPTKKKDAKPEAKSNPANDEAEFYLYQSEQELSKVIPDYDQAKANVIESFARNNINDTGAAMNYLSNIAKQKKVDIAKVIVAMDKVPSILEDILKAGANDFAVADILEAAASKVKTRDKKRIDSKPEPEINNSGPIDNSAATVEKLRKAWLADSSLANHKRYMAAKNK